MTYPCPSLAPATPLATCRRALLLMLEIALCVPHHEFVSCYDQKACLCRIILVSVRNTQKFPEFLLYVVLIAFQSKYEGIDDRWFVLQRYTWYVRRH